jgi:hypothetical protein
VATLQLVLREGGARGLWRGTGPTVIRLSFGAAINMVVLERLKSALVQQLEGGGHHLSSLNAALVGGLSRAISAATMSPVTLVKTRMEYSGADGARYRGTLHALQTIVKQDGARGLWRGLGPTVSRRGPGGSGARAAGEGGKAASDGGRQAPPPRSGCCALAHAGGLRPGRRLGCCGPLRRPPPPLPRRPRR